MVIESVANLSCHFVAVYNHKRMFPL